jgi:hypothetical protein
MKTKIKTEKEDLKIVSRPSNEEIEEDENGHLNSRDEQQKYDDEITLNDQEQGREDG